jgi:hypothetical protein
LKEHPAGTQVIITLQVPAELKLKLQSQAIDSKRTLSQEALRRLERSFSVQALQEDALALAVKGATAQFAKELMEKYEREVAEARQRIEPCISEVTKLAAEATRKVEQRMAEMVAAMARIRPNE